MHGRKYFSNINKTSITTRILKHRSKVIVIKLSFQSTSNCKLPKEDEIMSYCNCTLLIWYAAVSFKFTCTFAFFTVILIDVQDEISSLVFIDQHSDKLLRKYSVPPQSCVNNNLGKLKQLLSPFTCWGLLCAWRVTWYCSVYVDRCPCPRV